MNWLIKRYLCQAEDGIRAATVTGVQTCALPISERVAGVRPGEDREADYGPMTMPGQFEVVEKHIADALARGGRPVVGGMASIRKPFIGPVVIADVPEES